MKSEIDAVLRIPLTPNGEQEQRMRALQAAFAEVCNAIAPMVAASGVWNRVALHHMAYRPMREKYPQLGSQLVCNAIYAVSRTCRAVFQEPASPHHLSKLVAGQPLPTLRFSSNCPVYLDRNTFSLKDGKASLFTLDGRMRFQLAIDAEREQVFHAAKLVEILLLRVNERFTLKFHLQTGQPGEDDPAQDPAEDTLPMDHSYLQIDGVPVFVPEPAAARPTSGATAPSVLAASPGLT